MRNLPTMTAVLTAACILAACATNTGDPAKDKRARITNALASEAVSVIGRAAYATLANVAEAELNGTKVDYAHAATQNLWQSSVSVVNSATLERVMAAASDQTIPKTTTAAGDIFRQLAPKSSKERATVVNAIASTISSVALSKTK